MQSFHDLETPALLLDLDVLNVNLQFMADLCKENNIALRPHIKTHKCVEVAKMQLEYGATGITVATLREAEMMLKAGIQDIFIAYQIVGNHKLQRLLNISRTAAIRSAVDSEECAFALSEAAKQAGVVMPIMIEIDTGLKRAGTRSLEETRQLMARLVEMDGISVKGVFTHEGHLYTIPDPTSRNLAVKAVVSTMRESGRILAEYGVTNPVISVGSTPGAKMIVKEQGVGELRSGVYCFNDRTQVYLGASPSSCAVRVLATVLSVRSDGRVIVDAGVKALASDRNIPDGLYGIVVDHPELQFVACSEEHGMLQSEDAHGLKVGDKLQIVPNHCCTCVNMHEAMSVFVGDMVVDSWQISARGW